ncbi:MAG: PEP-CTERM sorting domain-containing protein [Armatimonadetes bacterium]|nr:PEP-CTERM sorting domain-containing protein [Armatimonadota bacterium]
MRNLIVSALTLAGAAVAATANSVTVDMGDHVGNNSNSTFLINYGGTKTVKGAPINAAIDGNPIVGYCVDLDHAAALNTTYEADTYSAIWLWNLQGARVGYIYNKYAPLAGDLDHQIALQVAIWESRYDSTLNLNSGTFSTISLNTTVKGYAQAILDDVAAASTFSDVCVYKGVNGDVQDIIGPAPVPEPASMAALGIGAMALIRRRKNRK